MPFSSYDEEDYYIIDSQEMQPDPYLNDHDLPHTPMVNYSGDANDPVNEVNVWEILSVDTGPLLGPFLSPLCLHIDPCIPQTRSILQQSV